MIFTLRFKINRLECMIKNYIEIRNGSLLGNLNGCMCPLSIVQADVRSWTNRVVCPIVIPDFYAKYGRSSHFGPGRYFAHFLERNVKIPTIFLARNFQISDQFCN
jgi:hypothetical protein